METARSANLPFSYQDLSTVNTCSRSGAIQPLSLVSQSLSRKPISLSRARSELRDWLTGPLLGSQRHCRALCQSVVTYALWQLFLNFLQYYDEKTLCKYCNPSKDLHLAKLAMPTPLMRRRHKDDLLVSQQWAVAIKHLRACSFTSCHRRDNTLLSPNGKIVFLLGIPRRMEGHECY